MAKRVNIPIVDLKREYTFLKKEIEKNLKSLFNSQRWILDSSVGKLEERIARYLGVNYAIGVASGTDALLLSLRAICISKKNKDFFDKKDEIITTPLTFIATAEAIVRSGATPVLVDIDPYTFNIDLFKIKKAINKNTVGIIPVHLYGLPCYMDEILKIASKYNLFVIEDCAQSFGAEYKGKKAGAFGDCGCFSFFPSKNLGGYGDGGLISTNSKDIAHIVKSLREHGQNRRYEAEYVGYTSRLDSIQAAVILAKLKHIDGFNRKRARVAKKYNKELIKIKNIEVPFVPKNTKHVYHLYTIKVAKRRDALLKYLNYKGINARIYYPVPLYKMAAFKEAKIRGSFENVKAVLSKILTLPIHPFLKDREISYVIDSVKSFFK